MSDRSVCDRCKRVEGIDVEKMHELSIQLIDPGVPEHEDNVLFWCEIDVCEKCLPVVEGIITERILTTSTPDDVYRTKAPVVVGSLGEE